MKGFRGGSSVAESPDGIIWRGTAKSIERLEGDEFVDAGPPLLYPSMVRPCGPISISGTTGEMVTASSSCRGIFTFDGKGWERYDVPEDGILSRVKDVLIDSKGVIWVGMCGSPSPEDEMPGGVWVLRRSLPALPMFLGVKTDASQYVPGGVMRVSLDLVGEGEARTVDLYVALETPSGELLFYPMFGTAMAPFLAGIEIPADTHIEDYELFSLTLPDVPAGTYRWYAACTHAGSMDFASNIASCEWQFE